MLRPSIPKFTLHLKRKCLFQQPHRFQTTQKEKQETVEDAVMPDERVEEDEMEKQQILQNVPRNPLYNEETRKMLAATKGKVEFRILGISEDATLGHWKMFIGTWTNLVEIRKALLTKEEKISSDAYPRTFPILHKYFMLHKRPLATKIMRKVLPRTIKGFTLNWSIQSYTALRDDTMLDFLYQKYPDCFPKSYMEKIISTYAKGSAVDAVQRERLEQSSKWIGRLGDLKSLAWNRERVIALMAFAVRANDVKLFIEFLNDYMSHEATPDEAWKAIKEILASETSEQTLKDLYESARIANMVSSDLIWGVVLGLNRFANTQAILDVMQKSVKSDPSIIPPQAYDIAVQSLLNVGDVENAYALFILRPDQVTDNEIGYRKTRTMLLLEMSKKGLNKQMLELFDKAWRSAVPPDSYGVQYLLKQSIEVGNDELAEFFWNQFTERGLVAGPVAYSLMAKHYLGKGQQENMKGLAEQLRETSEEGSRSRMIFGTARLTDALRRGNLDEALGIYQKMANPDAAVYSKIIPALLQAGRLQEARTELDRMKAKIVQEEKQQERILQEANIDLLSWYFKQNKRTNVATVAEMIASPIEFEVDEENEEE